MKVILTRCVMPILCTVLGAFIAHSAVAGGIETPPSFAYCAEQVGDGNLGECTLCCEEEGLVGEGLEACWTYCMENPTPPTPAPTSPPK